MEPIEILRVVNSLRLGDKIVVNDWHAKYTVCGTSQRYVLAHYGQHYTILSRFLSEFTHNAIRKGEVICAPDWFIFGYPHGYDFTNPDWVAQYMADLESGDTQQSQKKGCCVFFLSVVGHTDKVYRTAR